MAHTEWWKQFTSVWEGENTLSLETQAGAGHGWRSAWEPQPARLRQAATPCNLLSLGSIYDHHQYTHNCSIRWTNLYELSKWKQAFLSSCFKQVCGKTAKNCTWFMASTTFLFGALIVLLPHLHKTARIKQNSGLLCDMLFETSIPFRICFDLAFRQTQYHSIIYSSILHTNSLIYMSRKTRILTANAFLSLHARKVLLTSQIRAGLR